MGRATRTASSMSRSCQTPARLASFPAGPAGSHGCAHPPAFLHRQVYAPAPGAGAPPILGCHLTLSVWCGSVHFRLVLYPGSAQDTVLDPQFGMHPPPLPHLAPTGIFSVCLPRELKTPGLGGRYSQSWSLSSSTRKKQGSLQ